MHGANQFIPHSALSFNAVNNKQYLKDNTLYFRCQLNQLTTSLGSSEQQTQIQYSMHIVSRTFGKVSPHFFVIPRAYLVKCMPQHYTTVEQTMAATERNSFKAVPLLIFSVSCFKVANKKLSKEQMESLRSSFRYTVCGCPYPNPVQSEG